MAFWYSRDKTVRLGTSSIPVAEIGEPPYVAQADSEAETGEEELDRIVPLPAVSLLLSPVIRVVQVLAEKRVILPDGSLDPTVQGSIAAVLENNKISSLVNICILGRAIRILHINIKILITSLQ